MQVTRPLVVKVKQKVSNGRITFNLAFKFFVIDFCDSWLTKERELEHLRRQITEMQRSHEDFVKTYVERKAGKMKHPIEARLSKESERYPDWLEVFGGDVIPVLNAEPVKASLPIGVRDVYRLNVKALADDQYERLCQHIAHKFKAPLAEVRDTLDEQGLAILAEDITVCIDPKYLI